MFSPDLLLIHVSDINNNFIVFQVFHHFFCFCLECKIHTHFIDCTCFRGSGLCPLFRFLFRHKRHKPMFNHASSNLSVQETGPKWSITHLELQNYKFFSYVKLARDY